MTEPTLKIGPSGYKLNPEKLKGVSQSVLPYILGCFYFTEEYEYFDVIKDYLDIPEPKKSLEEISQELDEKFEKLIEQTKRNFNASNWDCKLRRYKEFCEKQDEDFEYAKEYGYFKKIYTLDGSYFVSNGSSVSWGTEFRICNNNTEVGYWDIKPNIKVYLEKKPNPIVRYFSKLLLDFEWKSTK
jgi:hypothetical protein